MNKRPMLYFAAPLFSHAERSFNEHIVLQLRKSFDVYLPQEDGGLLVDMVDRGIEPDEAGNQIFRVDIAALRECDVVLIVLDGRSVDEGAAFELGCAYMLRKQCYGLQTDPRRLLKTGNNPMIDCALRRVFRSLDDLYKWAPSFVQEVWFEQSSESHKVPVIQRTKE
jgi:nucleoside 2-deoxyribosyltransferase